MPIEIRELLIRAFVGNNEDNNKASVKDKKQAESARQAQNAQTAIETLKEQLTREKER